MLRLHIISSKECLTEAPGGQPVTICAASVTMGWNEVLGPLGYSDASLEPLQ